MPDHKWGDAEQTENVYFQLTARRCVNCGVIRVSRFYFGNKHLFQAYWAGNPAECVGNKVPVCVTQTG